MSERNDLPDGWVWTTLGTVAQYINGRAFKPVEWERKGLPIIRIQNLTNHDTSFNYYSQPVEDKYYVQNGDLLISWSATLDAFLWSRGAAILNQHIFKVAENSTVISKLYLYHVVRAFLHKLKEQTHGTGMQHITRGPFEATEIPLPPAAEQQRIVERIEELFEQSRTARTALDQIPALLDKLRRSALAAAFHGKLVPQNPDDEPASVLLERIRAERCRRWEADQLAKMRSQGKEPKDDNWKAKYQEPEPPDTSELPELPDGWCWTNLKTITEIRGGVTKGRNLSKYKTIKVPYLRVANVQNGYLDLQEVNIIDIKEDEFDKYRLVPGDILFTEGGDRDKLGRGTVWKGEIKECIHQNHVFCSRLLESSLSPLWVSLTSQTQYAREYFWNVARQTVNLASINITKLGAFPVPLAPLSEQQRIVRRLDEIFAQINAIESAVEITRHRLDKLDQAILDRAFQGKLVPQDPNDEPASVLLERIQAERQARNNSR